MSLLQNMDFLSLHTSNLQLNRIEFEIIQNLYITLVFVFEVSVCQLVTQRTEPRYVVVAAMLYWKTQTNAVSSRSKIQRPQTLKRMLVQ
jgi:hypothetical protein